MSNARLRITVEMDGNASAKAKELDADTVKLSETLNNKLKLALSQAEVQAIKLATAQTKLAAATKPEEQAKLALEVNRAKVAIDQAADKADRYSKELAQVNTATKQAGGGMSFMKGVAGDLIGALGFAGMAAGAVSAGKAMIELGMKSEQTNIAFKTLIGSTTGAQKHLEELRDFAASTPFEFTDLTNASRKLQAFGFAAKDVVPMMTSMGDAVAAMGGGAAEIDRVTLAIGQMSAKGKIQAGEMLQLTEAGIPAWKYLAEAMGMTTAEVMKLSEKGLIPADKAIKDILAGMDKDFGGMMKAQADTAAGAMSNLTDAIVRAATMQGEKLNPAIKGFATGMANAINLQSNLNQAVNEGIISQQGAGVMLTKLQYGLLTQADVEKYLNELYKEKNKLFDRAIETTERLNITTAEAERETRRLGDAQSAMSGGMAEAYGAADILSNSFGELTARMLYNQLAADLDSAASLELARSMGLVSNESYNAAVQVNALREKYDTNKDGAISAAEGAAQYTEEAKRLALALNAIPAVVSTNYHINYTSSGTPNPQAGDAGLPGGDSSTYNPTPGVDPVPVEGPRATGGPVMAGRVYDLHANERLVMPANGYVLNQHDAMQAAGGFGGGRGMTVNIYAVAATAHELKRLLDQEAARADNRRRLN